MKVQEAILARSYFVGAGSFFQRAIFSHAWTPQPQCSELCTRLLLKQLSQEEAQLSSQS